MMAHSALKTLTSYPSQVTQQSRKAFHIPPTRCLHQQRTECRRRVYTPALTPRFIPFPQRKGHSDIVRFGSAKSHRGGRLCVVRTQAAVQDDLVEALLEAATRKQQQTFQELQNAIGDVISTARRGLEPLPPGFPAGPAENAALDLVQDPLAYTERMRAQYGGFVGLRIVSENVVLVSDPAIAEEVFLSSDFVKEGTAFFPNSSLVGQGLLVSDGDLWKRQRRLANPAFREAAVASYSAAITSVAVATADDWRPNTEEPSRLIDVYEAYNSLSLAVVTQALFGEAIEGPAGAEINQAIADAFDWFGQRSGFGGIIPETLPTPDNLRFQQAVRRLDACVYQLIASRQAALEEDDEKRDGLLDWLISARDEDAETDAGSDRASPAGMSDALLRDEVITLIIAGAETTALSLTWITNCLAQHPECADRLAAETRAVLGSPPRVPTAADYDELQYTRAIVLETLRLYPAAYMVGRCAAREVQLGGCTLPKGTTVLVSPHLMHRDADIWDEPLAFEPSRWLDENGRVLRTALAGMGTNGAYVPFGAGKRNCIGTGFAMMEMTLVLAVLGNEFRFDVPAGQSPVQPAALITLRPAGPVELEVKPRAAEPSNSRHH